MGLEARDVKPAAEQIWDHDREFLSNATAFYAAVAERTGKQTFAELEALFAGDGDAALSGGDAELWERCVASHRGYQAGLETLLMLPRIGLQSEFLSLVVTEELQPVFPARFTDPDEIERCTRALSPPPPAASDEIVTPMGGTFFAREAPDLPPLISVGDHFEAGQPLFVIEVMKMFNKVEAPFSGTVIENRMEGQDSVVVKKGDLIFRIEPDEQPDVLSEAEIAERRKAVTMGLLGA